jgi:hypothetical protein
MERLPFLVYQNFVLSAGQCFLVSAYQLFVLSVLVPRCFQWVREKAGENMELLVRPLLRIRYGKNSGSNGQASK